jgi:hypothetical protein
MSSSFQLVNFLNVGRCRKPGGYLTIERRSPLFWVHPLRPLGLLPTFIFQDLTNLSLMVLSSLYRLHRHSKHSHTLTPPRLSSPTNLMPHLMNTSIAVPILPISLTIVPLSCICLSQSNLYNLPRVLYTILTPPPQAAEKRTWKRTL